MCVCFDEHSFDEISTLWLSLNHRPSKNKKIRSKHENRCYNIRRYSTDPEKSKLLSSVLAPQVLVFWLGVKIFDLKKKWDKVKLRYLYSLRTKRVYRGCSRHYGVLETRKNQTLKLIAP